MTTQNPLDQIAAARAQLAQRTIDVFWIPNDERLAMRSSDTDAFDDIAAIGLVTLAYHEQAAITRRMADKSPLDVGIAFLAEATRAVVIGGPIMIDDADGKPIFAEESANPNPPLRIASSTDALRYITRMHPIALQRALGAYAELHTVKEENTKRFLASRTHIAG